MNSKTVREILDNTYRKRKYCVEAYCKLHLSNIRQRFHYYFDWKSFNIGFGFSKTTGISGWKYMLSFDLIFLSCWIYFGKIYWRY